MTTIAAGSSVTGFVPVSQTITFTPGAGGRISFNGRNQDGSAITPREIYAETAVAMAAGSTFSAEAIGVDGSHTDIQSSASGGSGGESGTIGATAVVIALSGLGLVGKLHRLSVAPDTGCTILVEQSSDGSSYTTLSSVTATTSWDYTPLPSESAVTHVRLTRSVGSSVASTYAIG